MKEYILTLDQGTTSSRCIIWDKGGHQVACAAEALCCIYPKPGWVEQEPSLLYESLIRCAKSALNRAALSPSQIAGIGITNQRETVIVWDRNTGNPIYNAIVWQCGRGAPYIRHLKAEGAQEVIVQKTGLTPNAYFSASKVKWIFDNVSGVRERAKNGELLLGTVDSWILWNITGGRIHATDFTNACRTILFNIDTLKWDGELLELFDIPACMLPEVFASQSHFGDTYESIFGESIPIFAVAGDQQSSLFGQCCFDEGSVKNTYGTGCFMLMNTGKKRVSSANGLLTTLTAGSTHVCPEYALEGSVFMGGALVQWLRDSLGLVNEASETEKLAESVKDTGGVYMVPAFTGLGAPYWDSDATGLITGITRGTGREHIIRAALEAICFQNADVLTAMESDSGLVVRSISADGGASENNFIMQFQADITGSELIRTSCKESTALGAAFLAGLACGVWKSKDEVMGIVSGGDAFEPDMVDEVRERKMSEWHEAVRRTIGGGL